MAWLIKREAVVAKSAQGGPPWTLMAHELLYSRPPSSGIRLNDALLRPAQGVRAAYGDALQDLQGERIFPVHIPVSLQPHPRVRALPQVATVVGPPPL